MGNQLVEQGLVSERVSDLLKDYSFLHGKQDNEVSKYSLILLFKSYDWL